MSCLLWGRFLTLGGLVARLAAKRRSQIPSGGAATEDRRNVRFSACWRPGRLKIGRRLKTCPTTVIGVLMFAGALFAQTEQRPRTVPAPAATPSPAAHAAPSPRDLKYPALHAVETPKAAVFTLSNGTRLLLMEDHDLPVIRGEARIRTGSLFDPEDKIGLAAMTATVLRSGGTRDMTGEQLDRKLDDMAATVDSSINESQGRVSFFSLAENSADVLALFHDVLTGPAFRGDQVDFARVQLANQIALRNEGDVGRLAASELRTLVYGEDNAYGWNMQYSTLDRIRRSDLVAFYKRYYFPKNIILAVSGDFETAKMKDQLEQLFGGWNAQQDVVPDFPKVTARPAPGVYLAKNTDVTQTYFTMGHLGGKMNDPDYAALALLSNILGGGSMGRLFAAIRVHLGAAYNISATWAGGFDHPGLFAISGTLKPIATASTLQAIRHEVERMQSGEVTDEELRNAREHVLNGLVFANGTRRKILENTLDLMYFGYPEDFMQQFQKALTAVTRADVARVAKQYLRPAELTTVVVGNPGEFVPALETLGTVHEIDLTVPASKTVAAPSDTASLEQGKQILARMQQAVGGFDKLAAVKDYTAVSEVHYSAPAGGQDLVETEKWMAPGNMREETDSPAGKNAIYCDGKSGWTARGRVSSVLRGPQLKAAQDDIFRSYFTLLASDKVAGRTVNALDSDVIEISTAEGQQVRVTVNPETGLPLQFSYQESSASGPPITVQETITRFGEAGGVRIPFEVSMKRNGMDFIRTVVKDLQVNTGLVLTDLERRP